MLEAAAITKGTPSKHTLRNTFFGLNNILGEDANDLREDNRQHSRAEVVGAEQVDRSWTVEIIVGFF